MSKNKQDSVERKSEEELHEVDSDDLELKEEDEDYNIDQYLKFKNGNNNS